MNPNATPSTPTSPSTAPTPRVSTRASEVEPFRAMVFGERATQLQHEGVDVIRLSLGEPDFGAPEAVRRAMADLMDGRDLPYTAALGLTELREEIAGFYKDRHGVDVDPGRIVITTGGSAGLLLAAAATLDPGDECIIADPSYPCNRELVKTFGATVVNVPTDAASRYHLTAASVDAAWTARTKAVMITTPSNPTGTCMPYGQLRAVCDLARARGAWRIVDETYLDLGDLTADGTPIKSALACDPAAITINSFSKYFGMTGWRLGWMVVPEPMIPAVDKLATNYLLCAPTPVQYAALACFTPETYAVCEARKREFLERRRIVMDGLDRIGLPLPARPDGAFYAYFDVSSTGLDAWTFCERALDEAHVALTPGRDFGPATADTHVRLSYAASREALEEALRRLERFVKSL